MLAIQAEDLKKEINKDLILKNINLELKAGSIYGIIGDNFSGRLELLKIISGLLKDYEGEVLILGDSLRKSKKCVENIGVSFGIEGFIEEYTGFRNLKILASIKESITEEEIENTLYVLGLAKVINSKVKEYNFEMRKRLSIAQAIMEKPSLIIIDEPFMYLDTEDIDKIKNILISINSSRKSTIILGARNEKYLKDICKCLYKMDNGELEVIN